MHPEKGFTLKESNYRDFMARIRQIAEALNWELFYEKRPSVDEELVREFYANLTLSEMTEVPVHGIKVPINLNAINEFFELPDFENDEYSSLMSNIKPKLLFLPSSHGTTISFERMVLLYSILTAEILANVKKTGYSLGTITDWDLYRIARDFVLQQQDEDPKEEEDDDPTENESVQKAEIPDEAEPTE
ncbi:hypothetical protein J1N35_015345 [Gossypium stocksii]|uniref:Uncharacterized protein n=1 Tax=Gossypium stocksii TaxID=47602 RepID=A0A9D3VY99_9ROSI|nr:hypothetical protein J1N35_015345 [Gossypium stocksii]